MTISTTKSRKADTMKFTQRLLIAAVWILIWELASLAVSKPLILVSPYAVFLRICSLVTQGDFWISIANSLSKILLGFILAVVTGTLFAVLSHCSSFLKMFLSPVFSVIKATPVASFTLLVFLWVSSSYLSSVIAFLMVMPIIYFNVYDGIGTANVSLIQMAKVFKVGTPKKIKGIYIPAASPFFFSACSVSLGFAWKSGIAAEVICIPSKTIGASLYNAKILLESPDIFAWTVVIIILSAVMEKLFIKLMSRLKAIVEK